MVVCALHPRAGARGAGGWSRTQCLAAPQRADRCAGLLLVNWLLSSCWDVHTFVVPVLGHERGYSASVIGTILGAFAVAAAVVRVFLPMLAARLREWAVVTAAMVVTAIAVCGLPLDAQRVGHGRVLGIAGAWRWARCNP